MKLRILQLALFSLLIATPVFSQTADQLAAKYGQPFNAYLIRPTLMMTVKYAENGQVSEMLIASRIEDGSNSTMAPAFVKEIVNELAPVATRGAKISSSKRLPIGFGGSPIEVEQFENVTISYHTIDIKEAPRCSGTAAIIIRWKNRSKGQAQQ